MDTLELLAEENEEAGSNSYIPLSQVSLLLVDWTDPEKIALVALIEREQAHADLLSHRDSEGSGPDAEVHLDLAIEICKGLYRHEDSKR